MATQVMATQITDEIEAPPENSWGRLLAANASSKSHDLIEEEYSIGRRATCEIVLDDAAISNVHCKITRTHAPNSKDKDDLVVFIVDSSANGTFINGERLVKGVSRAMKHGDEIRLTSKPNAPHFVFHDIKTKELQDQSEIHKKYNFVKRLGAGACGEVWLGVNKQTGSHFAIKIIQKKKFSRIGSIPPTNIMDEVDILARLEHPNVINVYEMFDSKEALYIVLELAKGGELFDRIVDKEKLSEDESRLIFRQLLLAVQYLHKNGVAHRDLKPENILLDRKDTHSLVKVTDFGLAKLVGPSSFMKTMCGTPTYQAPEVLLSSDQGYNPAVDLWSLGVILYICLCGFPPFSEDIVWHDKSYTVSEQICNGLYKFPAPYWDEISEDAKDLVKRLLTVEVDKRITIGDALAHPFMNSAETDSIIKRLFDEHQADAVKERLSDLSHIKVIVGRKHERDAEDESEEPATKIPK